MTPAPRPKAPTSVYVYAQSDGLVQGGESLALHKPPVRGWVRYVRSDLASPLSKLERDIVRYAMSWIDGIDEKVLHRWKRDGDLYGLTARLKLAQLARRRAKKKGAAK